MSVRLSIVAYILHLQRAEQRRAHVGELVSALPVPARVLDAVDGKLLDPQRLAAVYPGKTLFSPRYPFRLNSGEVGCFLSHRKAWQAIVDDGASCGLVLEDDVVLSPDFDRALDAARTFCGETGYVQFQTRPVRTWSKVQGGETGIVEPFMVPRRTSAQLVGRLAAEKLLASSRQIDRPVDVFLQHFWETGQRVHCATPSGAMDASCALGGTTIQNRKATGVTDKIVRTVQRSQFRGHLWARAALARMNQQGGLS